LRTLLQNRIKILSSIFSIVALVACALIFPESSHAKEQPEIAVQALFRYLAWEKFWSGEFYGENCYNKIVGKKVRLAIRQWTGPAGAHVFHNKEEQEQIVQRKIFEVYIPGTNFLTHGEWLGEKPVAQIDMGSAPPGCNINDLEPRVTNLLNDPHTKFLNMVLPAIVPLQLPSAAENLKALNILDAVKRSMEYYLNDYYFQPAPYGEPQRKISKERLERIKRTSRLLLARFNRTDPFLLVYYEGDDKAYQLEYPSVDILSQKNVYLQVGSAGPYLGEVSSSVRDKVMNHLLSQIKRNSVALQLQVTSFGAR
jgi:hypothetical protein